MATPNPSQPQPPGETTSNQNLPAEDVDPNAQMGRYKWTKEELKVLQGTTLHNVLKYYIEQHEEIRNSLGFDASGKREYRQLRYWEFKRIARMCADASSIFRFSRYELVWRSEETPEKKRKFWERMFSIRTSIRKLWKIARRN